MSEKIATEPNSYEELILRSIGEYNEMPDLNIGPKNGPENYSDRTTKIYIDWGKAGNTFMKLIKKKPEYWDPDQNLNQLDELKIDQYCTNFEKESFNPCLALDYTNTKQEEYAKQNKNSNNNNSGKINPIENKSQANKRTLWDTQTQNFSNKN